MKNEKMLNYNIFHFSLFYLILSLTLLSASANSGSTNFEFYDVSNSITAMVIENTTGNVGIGTTGPKNKLEVVGTVNATRFITYEQSATGITADTDRNFEFNLPIPTGSYPQAWNVYAQMQHTAQTGIRGKKFLVVQGGGSIAVNTADTDNADEGWIGAKATNDVIAATAGTGTATNLTIRIHPDFAADASVIVTRAA